MSKSVCPQFTCYSLWSFLCCPPFQHLFDPPQILSTLNKHICCLWFSARPLLHRVRKYTVTDAVMGSLSVNKQNLVVRGSCPSLNVSYIQAVNIYIHEHFPTGAFVRLSPAVQNQTSACDRCAHALLKLLQSVPTTTKTPSALYNT